MPNPTIAAGYPKAFVEFAVSRGADRAALLERSHLCLAHLENPEGRCPLTSYITLMKVGIELCNEPALALLFGEAVRLQDISIVGFLGETLSDIESGPAMMNRYARLALDPDDGGNSRGLLKRATKASHSPQPSGWGSVSPTMEATISMVFSERQSELSRLTNNSSQASSSIGDITPGTLVKESVSNPFILPTFRLRFSARGP